MPRRPRPAHRKPAVSAQVPTSSKPLAKAQVPVTPARKVSQQDDSEDDHSESDHDHELEDDEEVSSSSNGSISDDQDEEIPDADAPRVAQWVDDEELDEEYESDYDLDIVSESEEGEEHLQDDLASLPLGALRKAQRALAQASAIEKSDQDSENDEEEDESEPGELPSQFDSKGEDKGKEEAKTKRESIPKRANKHAPMETTSKRPVGRKRLGTDEKKVVPRDPRFLPLVGEFSAQKFHSQYGFLSTMHSDELKTLRDNLKRARKLLATSPRDLREEREQEVQRLERAVKRAESLVNKDRREKIEQEALQRVTQEEKAKQKAGKSAWYLKESDKKELLVRAKYDALAADGGKRAVKKAIERKQRKVGQKEKKRRPFTSAPPRTGGGEGASFGERRFGKRPNGGQGDDGPRSGKRRKFV